MLPLVRNVAHVHGACVLPDDDGYPEAWFTAHGERGPKFNPRPSFLTQNCQPSTTLWYQRITPLASRDSMSTPGLGRLLSNT